MTTKKTEVPVENDDDDDDDDASSGAEADRSVNKRPIDRSQTKNATVTTNSELLPAKRAVLWTSSRKRMRLPLQQGAKRPRRSTP